MKELKDMSLPLEEHGNFVGESYFAKQSEIAENFPTFYEENKEEVDSGRIVFIRDADLKAGFLICLESMRAYGIYLD